MQSRKTSWGSREMLATPSLPTYLRSRPPHRSHELPELSREETVDELLQASVEPGVEGVSPPRMAARVEEPKKERKPRLDWARLLRRTFALDVLACPGCGGRRQMLAYVTASQGVRSILQHLGLPTQPARLAAARSPQQGLSKHQEPALP